MTTKPRDERSDSRGSSPGVAFYAVSMFSPVVGVHILVNLEPEPCVKYRRSTTTTLLLDGPRR